MVFVKKVYFFFYLFLFLTLGNTQNISTSLNLVKVNDVTLSSAANNSSSDVKTNTPVNTTPSNINLNQSYIPTSSQNNSKGSNSSSSIQTNSISQTSSGLSYPQPPYNQQIYQNSNTIPIYPSSGQIPYYPQTPNISTSQFQYICQNQQNTYWTGNRCACQVGYTNYSNNCVPSIPNRNNVLNMFPRPIYLRRKVQHLQYEQQSSSSSEQSQQSGKHNCPINCFWNGQICENLRDKIPHDNNKRDDKNSSKNSSIVVIANDSIIDSNIVCKMNQVLKNGKCVPVNVLNTPNIEQNNTNIVNCPQGQYFNNVTCTDICIKSHIYNAVNQTCQCPYGLIESNDACIQCQSNQYFQNGACNNCTQNSLYSQSSNKCQCTQGYIESSGKCINNATLPINQTTSSVVDEKADSKTTIQNNNSMNGSLQMNGKISMNNNNVMIVLKTYKQFKFNSNSDMENFIKTSFDKNKTIPSVYCNQEANNLSLFDCLLIYPSGVPNNPFSVNFYYNYNNQQGNLTVNVDPIKYQTNSRSNLR